MRLFKKMVCVMMGLAALVCGWLALPSASTLTDRDMTRVKGAQGKPLCDCTVGIDVFLCSTGTCFRYSTAAKCANAMGTFKCATFPIPVITCCDNNPPTVCSMLGATDCSPEVIPGGCGPNFFFSKCTWTKIPNTEFGYCTCKPAAPLDVGDYYYIKTMVENCKVIVNPN